MIYLDTSVALAQLLAEDRRPPDEFWWNEFVSSRLLHYEVWNRVHRLNLSESHGDAAASLIGRIAFVELAPPILERALQPFPGPVRTLDALHLASAHFLIGQAQPIRLATYDRRMLAAARELGIPSADC